MLEQSSASFLAFLSFFYLSFLSCPLFCPFIRTFLPKVFSAWENLKESDWKAKGKNHEDEMDKSDDKEEKKEKKEKKEADAGHQSYNQLILIMIIFIFNYIMLHFNT